jgi:hypothetical protein
MDRQIEYEHTQIGWLIVVLTLVIELILLMVMVTVSRSISFQTPVPYVFLLLLLLIAMFGTLKVQVTAQNLQIAFGIGLIRKSFAISEIREVQKVRNKWWYGWGIRAGLFRGFNWLFNVSGLDAVQIRMSNGHIYRIGTDDVDRLYDALSKRILSARSGAGPAN